jgi:hypothetical protein
MASEQQRTINQNQQKTMFDLPPQKWVKQFRLGSFDGFQILEKQGEKQPKSVCIIRCMFQSEKNTQTNESPDDEQAMVNESLFQA